MPRPLRPLLFTTLACAAITLTAAAQPPDAPVRFSANAINMNAGAAGAVEIAISRWSTNAERDKLMSAMLESGPDKLLDVLKDTPRVGYFRTPGQLGIDIHFARRRPTAEGGSRIVLVTDRRIGFWEAANQPRSIDYPFTVIELQLNREGEGEGKISVATKIIADAENNIITLENYDTQPVMLTNVRTERASTPVQ